MQVPELKTVQFWEEQARKQKLEPIFPEQYAEWLTNPVTQRLFSDLEYRILVSQSSLTEYRLDDSATLAAVNTARGEVNQAEWLFAWTPDEVILEEADGEH